MTTTIDAPAATRASARQSGVAWALASAAAFGVAGALARSLLELGWTPAAIVSIRVGGAFAVLLVPCLLLLRRIGLPSLRQSGRLLAYGAVAVGLAQLCYFSAVQYLSVGVALLLEYTAPVLLVGWHWASSRRRPRTPVLIGAAASLIGLALVLDLRSGFTLNPIGIAWGLGAALCLCGYFILTEEKGSSTPIHPLLLNTAGLGVGAVIILTLGLTGALPFEGAVGTVRLAATALPWWVPMIALVGVSATFAYLAGVVAVRLLGSSVASFVFLTEVLFAVTFAFLLLGQQPTPVQALGGLIVLIGIAAVQRGSAERRAVDPT